MRILLLLVSACVMPVLSPAESSSPCPRFDPGSTITEPENLYSRNGRLEVAFTYQTRLDNSGNTLYCFTNSDGAQSPTLHVQPGDELIIHLKNKLAPGAHMTMAAMPEMAVARMPADSCGTGAMTSTAVNIHYHGANVPPVCHQDEVIQ